MEGDLSPARLLYAEDDALLSEVIADCLRERGYAVSVAADGAEGLALAEDGAFDVVLTDLDTPRMSGAQMVAALRRAEPGLPVVVLSGNPPPDGYAAFSRMGHGPLLILTKPVEMRILEDAIRAVYAPRRAGGGDAACPGGTPGGP